MKYLKGEIILELDNILVMFIDDIKKFFFPEEWIKMDLKFSKTEIFTMLLLDRNKQVTMSELVEYINSPMSTATGIIDRLVKNGYIKRERSESDRRIVVIELTDTGSLLIKNLKNLISKYLKLIFDDLSEEEKQLLLKIALKVKNKMVTEINNQTTNIKNKTTIKKIDIE